MTTFLTIFTIWYIWPHIVIERLPIPREHKNGAHKSFLRATLSGWACLLPNLLAPFIVWLPLLFTPRSADKLPALFRWWDNDVSINGDNPKYWDPAYDGITYYAKAHPRSFWARYVWLGLRNRASWLAQRLGHTWAPGEYEDVQTWGDKAVNKAHEGWVVNRRAGVYQIRAAKKLGKVGYHMHWGYKVWADGGDHRKVANIVCISFSFGKWEGK